MKSKSESLFQQPGREEVQRMVEILGKAGWIVSAGVTPQPFAIRWSSKGRTQMSKLRNVMKKYAPRMFTEGEGKRIGWIAEGILEYKVRRILGELELPVLPSLERAHIVALAVASEEDADGQIAEFFEDELP